MEGIAAALLSVIVAVFAEANIGIQFNIPGIGGILATAIMGGWIITAINRKK